MEVGLVWLDEDTGRAEVMLAEGEDLFSIRRDSSGNWSDGSLSTPISPEDSYQNFSVISGKEAESLSQEALAIVSSPKPIRNKAANLASA